jgi:hypothetical protein
MSFRIYRKHRKNKSPSAKTHDIENTLILVFTQIMVSIYHTLPVLLDYFPAVHPYLANYQPHPIGFLSPPGMLLDQIV